MSNWIPDGVRHRRDWIAALLILGWMGGGVAVWFVAREQVSDQAALIRLAAFIIVSAGTGIWVSLTLLNAAIRRVFGWQWKAMDLSKYDYSRHKERKDPVLAGVVDRRPD